MRYIEVRPGLNINKDKIVSVEMIDEMSCKVCTAIGEYESIYPSWRILSLLELPSIEESMAMKPSDNPDTTTRNLWGHQHFAG